MPGRLGRSIPVRLKDALFRLRRAVSARLVPVALDLAAAAFET